MGSFDEKKIRDPKSRASEFLTLIEEKLRVTSVSAEWLRYLSGPFS